MNKEFLQGYDVLPELKIEGTIHAVKFDDDIILFDNIDSVVVNYSPFRLVRPVFGLCLNGSAKIKVNLQEYEVPKNGLLTLTSDSYVHEYSHSDDFEGVFLVVSNRFVDQLMPNLTKVLPVIIDFKRMPISVLTEEEATSIREFHKFIWKKIEELRGEFVPQELGCLVRALFYEVVSIYRRKFLHRTTRRSRNEETFYKFFSLLESEFNEHRTVCYYAERLCITPKHLTSVVRMVSGKSAGAWIDEYVILSAKHLLRSTSLTIQEVSRELNFPNQSFFGKFFKKHVGMTPSQYRSGV